MLTKKTIILIFSFCFLLVFSCSSFNLYSSAAEKFESPEEFSRDLYQNYSQENFALVYQNFAAELKKRLSQAEYVEFQNKNFEKYNLVYTNIKIGKAEKIDFQKIKEKFDYVRDFGDYYQLKVSYLIKFDRFGRREKETGKDVYLRKTKEDFQLFWDYKEALDLD